MASALADSEPPWIAKNLKKLAPAIGIVGAGLEAAGPFAFKAAENTYEIYKKLPHEAIQGLCGLGLCFYGGRYTVTIAAIEAFNMTGGSQMIKCLNDVAVEIRKVMVAFKEDDKADTEEDQANSQELVKRKLAVVMRTVDPAVLSDALGGLTSGYMGMLAVLKFKFAQTVALAHSIGDYIRPSVTKVLAPSLISLTPPDYHRWISPVLNCGCKMVAGFVAWKIQQAISTVQCGVQGGLMASRAALMVLRAKGYFQATDDETLADEIGGYSLAASGVYFQFRYGGLPLPFFFKPMFWPLDLVEWWLKWSVTWIAKDAPPS